MSPVVEVKDVYKSFKSVQAVRGVSFAVEKGQSTALLGPNGAGKTTLVEMIEGIQKPDKGEIRILGKTWRKNEDALHRAIGLCLQETRFIDKLTVRETLRLFASFYELGNARVAEILDIIGLFQKQNTYTVNLSGGQRQRLALGLSLINRPRVLLLDEPTTGLDPNARRGIWSILLGLKEHSQTSLILTTHYMEEAEQLCDTIMIMDQGRVLDQGSLESLLEDGSAGKVMTFTLEDKRGSPGQNPPDPGDLAQVLQNAPFPVEWDHHQRRGRIALSHFETQLPEFFRFLEQRHLRVKNMECRRKTLDDLFTAMTGRQLHE